MLGQQNQWNTTSLHGNDNTMFTLLLRNRRREEAASRGCQNSQGEHYVKENVNALLQSAILLAWGFPALVLFRLYTHGTGGGRGGGRPCDVTALHPSLPQAICCCSLVLQRLPEAWNTLLNRMSKVAYVPSLQTVELFPLKFTE